MASPHYTHDFLLNIGGINIGVYLGKNLQQEYFWCDFFSTRLKNCLNTNASPPTPSFKIIFSGPRAELRRIDKRTVGKHINYPQIKGHTLTFNNLLHPNRLLLSIYSLIERELAKNHILTLHASGIVMGGHSVLFCGDPGSGKSTVLTRRPRESLVLGDDKIILKVNNGEILAFPSPFNDKVVVGNISPTGAPVSGVIFIQKHGPPACNQIPPSESVALIMNQMLTGSYNKKTRGLLLNTAIILSNKTYLLSYNLGEDINQLLKEIVK